MSDEALLAHIKAAHAASKGEYGWRIRLAAHLEGTAGAGCAGRQRAHLDYGRATRQAAFLAKMETLVPWAEACALIALHYPKRGNGRQPVGMERTPRFSRQLATGITITPIKKMMLLGSEDGTTPTPPAPPIP